MRIFEPNEKFRYSVDGSSALSIAIFQACKQIIGLKEQAPFADLVESICKLVEEKRAIQNNIKTLTDVKENLQWERRKVLDEIQTNKFRIKRFEDARQRLQQFNISADSDLERLVNILDNLGEGEHDIKEIINALAEVKKYSQTLCELRREVNIVQNTLNKTKNEVNKIEERRAAVSHELSIYYELEKNGIYLSHLITLRNKVIEMSLAKKNNGNGNFTPTSCWGKFVTDMQIQYDVKLGFERKLRKMKEMLYEIDLRYQLLLNRCTILKDTFDNVEELTDSGMRPSDISNICNTIQASRMEFGRIIQNLQYYGSLEATIGQLEAKAEKLGSDCDDRLSRVNNLKIAEECISKNIGSMVKEQTLIEKNFEDRIGERVRVARMAIKKIATSSLIAQEQERRRKENFEAQERQKLDLFKKIDASLELSPIIEASRGLTVDNEALRFAVVKSIEIMISTLDPDMNSTLAAALRQAVASLKSEFIIF